MLLSGDRTLRVKVEASQRIFKLTAQLLAEELHCVKSLL